MSHWKGKGGHSGEEGYLSESLTLRDRGIKERGGGISAACSVGVSTKKEERGEEGVSHLENVKKNHNAVRD